MKQKFTLHIADLQLSVVADASPEEVDRISGILDRKMREIYLKSRCPKTEAALLCALDAVADRLGQQAEVAELEERCEKYAIVLETLKARNEEAAAELERLQQENDILRSLISAKSDKVTPPPIAPDPIPPTAFFTEVAEAQLEVGKPVGEEAAKEDEAPTEEASVEEAVADTVEETAEEPVVASEVDFDAAEALFNELLTEKTSVEETPKPEESPRSRSRVGSMFDLLSFDEVD